VHAQAHRQIEHLRVVEEVDELVVVHGRGPFVAVVFLQSHPSDRLDPSDPTDHFRIFASAS
jgi:carbamate kinase